MAHYKNRRPKPHKGHCGMCCLRTTDGRRNGRLPSLAEQRAAVDVSAEVADATCANGCVCGWCAVDADDSSCEGCVEGLGLVHCDEHPPSIVSSPLVWRPFVKLAA
jgi:hypothetical protein